jgi:hypothetical protein
MLEGNSVRSSALRSLVAFCAGVWFAGTSAAIQDPDQESVLRRAATYIAGLERAVSGLVVDEEYRQRLSPANPMRSQRELRSELAAVRMASFEWVVFRDVFEVDGKTVRDRDERLRKLFFETDAKTALERARLISQEGARFDLQPPDVGVLRTVNNPFLALRFLQQERQPGFEFRLEGTRTVGNVSGRVVRYRERGRPRQINTPDSAPVYGSFVIEPETGRVLWSEIGLDTRDRRTEITLHVRVTFAEEAKSGHWLPVSLDEVYTIRRDSSVFTITGRAEYSNFRFFSVTIDIRKKRSIFPVRDGMR